MNKSYPFWALALFLITHSTQVLAQYEGQSKLVKDVYTFRPVQKNGTIEWDKFPEFSLPKRFKIVYQGPRFKDDVSQKPLKHGFSHLATYNFPADQAVPFANRADFSSGIPMNSGQPWSYPCLNPWGNDMTAIRNQILAYTGHCDFFKECALYDSRVPVDLFVHDFESNAADDNWILYQRSLTGCMPAPYQGLPDSEFLKQYKKAQIILHADLMKYTKEQVLSPNTKLSLYGEAPLVHSFYDIAEENNMANFGRGKYSNYLLQDPNSLTYSETSPVMKSMDFLTPWAYYHYIYNEKGVTGQKGAWSYLYLPYLLFNIEGQKLYSNKQIVPFVNMRIQPPEGGDTDILNQNIDPDMAEATAIFSLMTGDGVWIWDQINIPMVQDPKSSRNFTPYEYFIAGLYRMSRHNAILESPDDVFAPLSSRDLAGTRRPTVRGLVKGKRILIAAQATDVNPTDITKVPLEYKNWKDTITLVGREVYLAEAQWTCEFPESNIKPFATNDSPKNEGQTVKLNAAGGMNYEWRGPGEFMSHLVNPMLSNPSFDLSGIYTVTARVTPACTNTTTTEVKIIKSSLGCVSLNLKVLLEGPYNPTTGLMKTTLNQKGLLPGQTPIDPQAVATDPCQPYKGAPWNYLGNENIMKYDADVVDWLYINLRKDILKSTSVFEAAAVVKSDGTVVFNHTCANFSEGESFNVVIEHRNHLGVMTTLPIRVINRQLTYDFTKADSYRTINPPSFGQKLIGSKWLMYAMDTYKFSGSQNYDINAYDQLIWKVENGLYSKYLRSDVNLDGETNAGDSRYFRQNNGTYSKVPH